MSYHAGIRQVIGKLKKFRHDTLKQQHRFAPNACLAANAIAALECLEFHIGSLQPPKRNVKWYPVDNAIDAVCYIDGFKHFDKFIIKCVEDSHSMVDDRYWIELYNQHQ